MIGQGPEVFRRVCGDYMKLLGLRLEWAVLWDFSNQIKFAGTSYMVQMSNPILECNVLKINCDDDVILLDNSFCICDC